MTKIVYLLSAFLFFTLSTPIAIAQSTNSTIRGFNDVDFDSWTQILTQNNFNLPNYAQNSNLDTQTQLLDAISKNPVAKDTFLLIKNYFSKYRYQTSNDFISAASDILALRQEVRDLNLPASTYQEEQTKISNRKNILYMLELMAEEPLLVGITKIKNFPKSLEISNPRANTTLKRNYVYEKLSLQSGDVIIFRSVGEGSSSFIALGLKDPHIASHSTVVYVSPEKKLLSPEAFIEDGVKLRDLIADMNASGKARIYIYRLKNSFDVALRTQAGVDNFVKEMFKRVSDPTTQAAFPYGFSMLPDPNAKEFSCTDVGYEIYKRAGLSMSLNPYSDKYWSKIDLRSRNLFDALGIDANKVPAPGDIESNSNFQLVGLKIITENILEEQIESAIIDSMLNFLDSSQYAQQMEVSLKNIGNRPLQKDDIQKLASSGLLDEGMQKLLQSRMDQIPNNINIKQLVFFYMMNEQITPKLRDIMTTKWKTEWQKNNRIMGPVEMRVQISKIIESQVQPIIEKINVELRMLNETSKNDLENAKKIENKNIKAKQIKTCAKVFA